MSVSNSSVEIGARLELNFYDIHRLGGGTIGEEIPGLEGFEILDAGNYIRPNGSLSRKAIIVRAPDGNIFVHFNGTGDGNWRYNADSAFGTAPSRMQEWASKYFDTMVGDLRRNNLIEGYLYVTGHSQGGNNAKYAALFSQHEDIIRQVIALDAPGFNRNVYEEARRLWGNQWDDITSRMFGINGENDFVHPLGERHIIPAENSFYIQTPDASDPYGFHAITTRFDENGRLNLWGEDAAGNKIERGAVANLTGELIDIFTRHLTPEQRQNTAEIVMSLVEWGLGYGETPEWPGALNALSFARDFAFVITRTALTNPDALMDVLSELNAGETIAQWARDNPLIVIALVMLSPVLIPMLLKTLKVVLVLHIIDSIIRALSSIAGAVGDFFVAAFNAVRDSIIGFAQWIRNQQERHGRNYAAENPNIIVNTGQLRAYASRISAVNRRIGNVDRAMNSLWRDVRLQDIPRLVGADLMTRQSPTLDRVQGYLNNAADSFETVDRYANKNMGG